MLDTIKKVPGVEMLYKVSWLYSLYHYTLALLGAILYSFPSRSLIVIGVTGTKGKTTTLELLNAILEASGEKTALVSSLRVKINQTSEKNLTGNSMPGRMYLQRFMRSAVQEGCRYALVEVTSQGTVLHRHRFIRWRAGALTNLAPEHIEAHGSFENYRDAKLAFLLTVASQKGIIILNADDESSQFYHDALLGAQVRLFSKKDELVANFNPAISVEDEAKPSDKFLLSDFNRENIAAATVIAATLGIPEDTIKTALRNFSGVSGRMEFVRKSPFSVIVDYAHTPDSLARVYETLRSLVMQEQESRLVCVLGAAGGGRDKWKRPAMGKIAEEYCDEIILTDEDPYDEDPNEILAEIKSGISEKRHAIVKEILNRQAAIMEAITLARKGDVVIVTGKGSESWLHLAEGKKIPWNERAIVERVLQNLEQQIESQ